MFEILDQANVFNFIFLYINVDLESPENTDGDTTQ